MHNGTFHYTLRHHWQHLCAMHYQIKLLIQVLEEVQINPKLVEVRVHLMLSCRKEEQRQLALVFQRAPTLLVLYKYIIYLIDCLNVV